MVLNLNSLIYHRIWKKILSWYYDSIFIFQWHFYKISIIYKKHKKSENIFKIIVRTDNDSMSMVIYFSVNHNVWKLLGIFIFYLP